MSYLSSARAAVWFHFPGRKAREVVVEHEPIVSAAGGAVDNLLIEFTTKRHGTEGLGLTTGKQGSAVSCRQSVYFGIDWSSLVWLPAVQTAALLKYQVSDCRILCLGGLVFHKCLSGLIFLRAGVE